MISPLLCPVPPPKAKAWLTWVCAASSWAAMIGLFAIDLMIPGTGLAGLMGWMAASCVALGTGLPFLWIWAIGKRAFHLGSMVHAWQAIVWLLGWMVVPLAAILFINVLE